MIETYMYFYDILLTGLHINHVVEIVTKSHRIHQQYSNHIRSYPYIIYLHVRVHCGDYCIEYFVQMYLRVHYCDYSVLFRGLPVYITNDLQAIGNMIQGTSYCK